MNKTQIFINYICFETIRYAKTIVYSIMFLHLLRDYHQEYNNQQDKLQHIEVHHENLYILYIFLVRCSTLRQKLEFVVPQHQFQYHQVKLLFLLVWFHLYNANRLRLHKLQYLDILVRKLHN